MKTIRKIGQFSLNYCPLQKLFNVTNEILLETTKDKGVSYWFDQKSAFNLLYCNGSEFIRRCKTRVGNEI